MLREKVCHFPEKLLSEHFYVNTHMLVDDCEVIV